MAHVDGCNGGVCLTSGPSSRWAFLERHHKKKSIAEWTLLALLVLQIGLSVFDRLPDQFSRILK